MVQSQCWRAHMGGDPILHKRQVGFRELLAFSRRHMRIGPGEEHLVNQAAVRVAGEYR